MSQGFFQKLIITSYLILALFATKAQSTVYYNLGANVQSNAPVSLSFPASYAWPTTTWSCNSIQISALDAIGRNAIGGSTNPLTVNLGGTNVEWYSDSACTTLITTATISQGKGNTGNVTRWFSFTVAGSDQSTATATAVTGATSPNTITNNLTSWTGACAGASPPGVCTGINNNWSNPGNWVGLAVPGTSDTAHFDVACGSGATCNATYDGSATPPASIYLHDNYTGTLTQASNLTLTGSIYILGGTFTADTSGISLAGNFALTGGIFKASSSGNLSISGNFTASGGTFNHNSGTVTLNGSSSQTISGGISGIYNLTLARSSGSLSVNSSLTVLGNLNYKNTGTSSFSYGGGGSLYVAKDVTASSCTSTGSGTGTIYLNGTTSQTITGVSGCYFPSIRISNTSAAVTLSGTVDIAGSFTVNTGASITTTGSTVEFVGSSSSQNISIASPSTNPFNILTFKKSSSNITLTSDVYSSGLITINQSSSALTGSGFNLHSQGGLTVTATSSTVGSAGIIVDGSSSQTISSINSAAGSTSGNGALFPSFTINSTGGTITFAGSNDFDMGGSFTYTSGTLSVPSTTVFEFVNSYLGTEQISAPSFPFNTVNFRKSGNINLAADMTATGMITFNQTTGSINGSYNLHSQGGVTLTANGGGSATLVVDGSSNQTISSINSAAGSSSGNGALFPHFTINSTGGTISFNSSNYFDFQGNFTYTTGTLSVPSSATMEFVSSSGSTDTITPSTFPFQNVNFLKSANITNSGTMSVAGAISVRNNSSTNTWSLGGDVSMTTAGKGLTITTGTVNLGSGPYTLSVGNGSGTLTFAGTSSTSAVLSCNNGCGLVNNPSSCSGNLSCGSISPSNYNSLAKGTITK